MRQGSCDSSSGHATFCQGFGGTSELVLVQTCIFEWINSMRAVVGRIGTCCFVWCVLLGDQVLFYLRDVVLQQLRRFCVRKSHFRKNCSSLVVWRIREREPSSSTVSFRRRPSSMVSWSLHHPGHTRCLGQLLSSPLVEPMVLAIFALKFFPDFRLASQLAFFQAKISQCRRRSPATQAERRCPRTSSP